MRIQQGRNILSEVLKISNYQQSPYLLGHTKLMFRITDFSGHFLGGEGGIKIKIKLTKCTKYAESESK